MLAHDVERARTSPRRRSRRLVLEQLEERRLLTGNPPFAVGGDPIVNPADFRVTTFASGLNYPHGMLTLSDGSLLVAVNNPISGKSFYNTTGQLLRFVDANGDGVADGAGQVLYQQLARGSDRVASGRRVHPRDQQRDRERANLRPSHRRDRGRFTHAGREHQLFLSRQTGSTPPLRPSSARRRVNRAISM